MTLPWYPRDMGKYARDTGTLSLAQHGAYNLLLDYYYSTGPINAFEQCSSNAPLMPDHSPLYRLCKATTKPEQDAVDFVLKKYFELKDGHYRNDKCDEVIEEQTKKHNNRVRAGSTAKHKQCSSNAPQTQTQTKKKKESQGAFHSEKGEKSGDNFSVERHMTDAFRAKAKAAAPGWDIYFLMREFDQRVNGGSFERPKAPGPAFVAWCASFTKGKAPT